MARDAAAIIEALLDPPVVVCGKSMGGFIGLQLLLDRPDLCRAGIVMGVAPCGHEGWLGDYMRAEVELRRQGGRLEGMFATIALRRAALPRAGARRPGRLGADPARARRRASTSRTSAR